MPLPIGQNQSPNHGAFHDFNLLTAVFDVRDKDFFERHVLDGLHPRAGVFVCRWRFPERTRLPLQRPAGHSAGC